MVRVVEWTAGDDISRRLLLISPTSMSTDEEETDLPLRAEESDKGQEIGLHIHCSNGRKRTEISQLPVHSCSHLCIQNTRVPLQRSRSRQNINFSSTRAPAAREAHYEKEAHPSTARRAAPAHRLDREREREREKERERERARDQESEKEQTPTGRSANGDADVEALLARLRAL
ncbi:hypothetical protein MHYP_G00226860 [Metynnis hypsauchen]